MRDALKRVLWSLTDRERATLDSVVEKMVGANDLERFPCPSDCDKNLARINLCAHCQLEEQLLRPTRVALRDVSAKK